VRAQGGSAAGADIVRAAWWGTGVFAVAAVAAVVVRPLRPVSVVVDVVLFAAGCVAFGAAYVRGLGRSRRERVAVTGLYLLAGSAPVDVRRRLLGALAAQVVIALATAIARPYTSLAAGTLVPMYGLGLCGLWAARHGTFPPRPDLDPPGKGRRRGR
jgi:hypothetical protein